MLLLAGSRHNWQLPSVALMPQNYFPHSCVAGLSLSWRSLQSRQALEARLPWPTRPSIGPCARGSSIYEGHSLYGSLFAVAAIPDFSCIFTLSLHQNGILSWSRPAGAGFPMSFLLHAKPAPVHHCVWPKVRDAEINAFAREIAVSLKVSMLCVMQSLMQSHSLTLL